MFEDFLKAHIEDYIECSDMEYDINEEQIESIASEVNDNERIWEEIDCAIADALIKYAKEDLGE